VYLQRVFFDDRAVPDAIHELILGDELARRPHQGFNNLEGAPADGDRLAADPQLAPGEVYFPTAGLVNQLWRLRRHRSPPPGASSRSNSADR
jgi:hypothetical protein